MYRIQVSLSSDTQERLRRVETSLTDLYATLIPAVLEVTKQQAVAHLSGVPFTSETGTHVINKRTGKGAASVQTVYPYRSVHRGVVFASAMTRYANNPEEYNYLAILEYGRGPIRPKHTASVLAGKPNRARLTIPGGPYTLVHGVKGFRGKTGFYRFTKEIPAMEGKYWMRGALEAVRPKLDAIANKVVNDFLDSHGF